MVVYSISNQFKQEGDNLAKIYGSVLRFIRYFSGSKHPSTICWLLEIIYILSAKFTSSDAYKQDPKLKKEYADLLTQLLQNIALIVSDQFNIDFDKDYGFKIAFPPTVYELLRKYYLDANCKALFEDDEVPNMHQFDEKDKSQEFMTVLTEYIEQKDDK
eukprot:CAMPEP_0202959044 /NCGR_PEP_ID=MMETSP1396-20130829/3308_1 /ASSEMBLY_ACC=CAM_ASM_000872 /TAXON_ID= /ORGANISM="Pseudokeronopsis sp., Strain Brazil" /LENGTH=158 /DNA_ID=CAMNT_0049677421 /DNA_START=4290 /DNA_END=4766 /DNA_ORIENTATION=+